MTFSQFSPKKCTLAPENPALYARRRETFGHTSGTVVAKQWRRSAIDVRWRRRTLGIKPFVANW